MCSPLHVPSPTQARELRNQLLMVANLDKLTIKRNQNAADSVLRQTAISNLEVQLLANTGTERNAINVRESLRLESEKTRKSCVLGEVQTTANLAKQCIKKHSDLIAELTGARAGLLALELKVRMADEAAQAATAKADVASQNVGLRDAAATELSKYDEGSGEKNKILHTDNKELADHIMELQAIDRQASAQDDIVRKQLAQQKEDIDESVRVCTGPRRSAMFAGNIASTSAAGNHLNSVSECDPMDMDGLDSDFPLNIDAGPTQSWGLQLDTAMGAGVRMEVSTGLVGDLIPITDDQLNAVAEGLADVFNF